MHWKSEETVNIVEEVTNVPNTYGLIGEREESPTDAATSDEAKLMENIVPLLKVVVGEDMLSYIGPPNMSVDHVLRTVIERYGHVPFDRNTSFDLITQLRANARILLTSVNIDDSIKEMLNYYTIDDVISFVIQRADKYPHPYGLEMASLWNL